MFKRGNSEKLIDYSHDQITENVMYGCRNYEIESLDEYWFADMDNLHPSKLRPSYNQLLKTDYEYLYH